MSDVAALYDEIDHLASQLALDGRRQAERWADWSIRGDFVDSADNLAAYLALRRLDIRKTQRNLMALGLSSLGRLESRVMPTLAAVRAALAALAGAEHEAGPKAADFFKGEALLAARTRALF